MSNRAKNIIIAFFTFIGGLYFFLEYLLPDEFTLPDWSFIPEWGHTIKIGAYNEQITLGVQVVGVMAIGLGLINIFAVHGPRVIRGKSGWYNSAALLLGLVAMLIFEGADLMQSEEKGGIRLQFEGIRFYLDNQLADQSQSPTERARHLDNLIASLKRLDNSSTAADSPLSTTDIPPDEKEAAVAFKSTISNALTVATGLRNGFNIDPTLAQRNFPQESTALETAIKESSRAAFELAELNYNRSYAKKASGFFNEAFFVPLGAAMFALLAFYIASAAYRSFRVRSLEAFFMMCAALVVMLGQIPFGPLYIYHGLPDIRLWLLDNISTPAFRAIFFGSSVAGLAMAVRMWLSLEKSPLSADSDSLSVGGQKS